MSAQNKDGPQPNAPSAWDLKSLSPSGVPVKELLLMKLGALLTARYGTDFLCRLKVFRTRMLASALFDWLQAAYERVIRPYSYYGLGSYDSVFDAFLRFPPLENLEEGVETETDMIDLHAFVSGVDSLAHMDFADYSANMPEPKRFSLIMEQLQSPLRSQLTTQHGALTNPPSSGLSLVEHCIFKLTALFAVRYEPCFRRALMRRVVTNPRFEFLYFRPDLKEKELFSKETESRYYLFIRHVGGYSRVVKYSGKPYEEDGDDFPATLLEFFLGLLQLEKLEEGVETAVIDIQGFLRGFDYFAYMDRFDGILPPPERLSTMMNWPRPLGSQFIEYPARSGDQDRTLNGHPLKLVRRSDFRGDQLFRFPARGITLKELGIMKLTAQFGMRYGNSFESLLLKRVGKGNPLFGFLLPSNSWSNLYCKFLAAYVRVFKMKESDACLATVVDFFLHRVQLDKFDKGMPTATAMLDLHAFMGGVDYFAYTGDGHYSSYMPQPERLSMMINRVTEMQPDTRVQIPLGSQSQGECVGDAQSDLDDSCQLFHGWAILEKLGIMKLTAMFVARYGMYFYWDLWKKVGMKPQFKFMEPSDWNFRVYNRIADAYERVLEPVDLFDVNKNASTEPLVDAFLSRLQLEKLEERQVTALLDLHAFLCGVDYFAHVENEVKDAPLTCTIFLSNMLDQLTPGSHLFDRCPVYVPPINRSTFYYPSDAPLMRGMPEQKVDKSALGFSWSVSTRVTKKSGMFDMFSHPPPKEPEPDKSTLVSGDQFDWSMLPEPKKQKVNKPTLF